VSRKVRVSEVDPNTCKTTVGFLVGVRRFVISQEKYNKVKFGGGVVRSRSFFSSVVRIGMLTIGSSADSGFEEERSLFEAFVGSNRGSRGRGGGDLVACI
jgi:hypothetical protein